MIEVTRLNGEKFMLNPHQIEFIEKTPDTIISLASGRKVVVRDTIDSLIERVIQYRKKLGAINQDS